MNDDDLWSKKDPQDGGEVPSFDIQHENGGSPGRTETIEQWSN